jgi:hypothetical protein
MDDPKSEKEHRVGNVVLTGVTEAALSAKICSQGGEPVDLAEYGLADAPFMAFKKFFDGKWRYFTVPKCMGLDGYQDFELTAIEEALAYIEMELYPLDYNLH